MKRNNIIIMVVLLMMPFVAGAQALKGSYFIDNSLNRNKMNPAFAPRTNYFQMPAMGNLYAGVMSNLDVPTFLYPMNGELVTFLNSQVSVDQFEIAGIVHVKACKLCEYAIKHLGEFTVKPGFLTSTALDPFDDLVPFLP